MNLQTFRRSFNPRREFDPTSHEDLIELKYFKDNGKWRNGCPFYVEDPFIEVPAMCYFKYSEHMLSQLKVTTRKQKSPK
jgi:hypothetical protein